MVSNCVHKVLLSCLLGFCLAPPAAAKTTFVVFPLENQSRVQTLSWIGEGLAIAISEEMQMPNIETISWEERVRFVESSDLPPNTPLSRASMIRIAQRAAADKMVFGSYTGTEDNLRIVLRVLDVKSLRMGGEKVANGPLTALPQLENELAWEILSDGGWNGILSRADFRARTRTVPNKPYSSFIACLSVTDEEERSKLLLKTVELYRNFPQAAFLLGAHYYQSGDCLKAIPYLKQALTEAQNLLETEFMLGTCYLKQDNAAEAIQAYSAFMGRDQALEVLNNLGVAYLRRGDYPLAVQNLIEARKVARTDVTVGLNLALLRHIEGDEAAALAVLEELVRSHPEQGIVQYLYSLALSSRGEAEKAAAALEQAQKLGIDPEKMKRQDPRNWARIFPSWTRRPGLAWAGAVKITGATIDRSGANRQRH
ncbi:MAG: tetratricopeptide repeat protein [Acidobacteriia bacterium]|nr:tetratricopeptide repeat protein [Terriglobia bacterium]